MQMSPIILIDQLMHKLVNVFDCVVIVKSETVLDLKFQVVLRNTWNSWGVWAL